MSARTGSARRSGLHEGAEDLSLRHEAGVGDAVEALALGGVVVTSYLALPLLAPSPASGVIATRLEFTHDDEEELGGRAAGHVIVATRRLRSSRVEASSASWGIGSPRSLGGGVSGVTAAVEALAVTHPSSLEAATNEEVAETRARFDALPEGVRWSVVGVVGRAGGDTFSERVVDLYGAGRWRASTRAARLFLDDLASGAPLEWALRRLGAKPS